jgi:hypothetical protein
MNIENLIADLEAPVELANTGANVGGYACLGILVIGIIIG